MNPASPEFHNRAATSPALFNRCVLDWFGEWTNEALFQVGSEFTKNTDLDDHAYKVRVWLCFRLRLSVSVCTLPTHELGARLLPRHGPAAR